MKKNNWYLVGIIGVVALLLVFGAGMMSGWGNGGWGHRGYGMMGNLGYSPLGWFGMAGGMLLMWLVPIGILALTVFGVASLIQNNGSSKPTSTQSPCPNCGKSIQADWQNCPYCGNTLKK